MATNDSALIIPAPRPATNTATTNATLDADIRDIRGPVAIPSGWLWLAWTLGLLAAAVIASLAWRYRLRQRPPRKPPTLVIPPHVRARNSLRQALSLLDQPKPFCFLVSNTLRVYLEERFDLHAPERTTEEFLEELPSSPVLSHSQKQTLGDFLMRCDLVKFARYEPGEPELRELLDAAIRLVDETTPAPEPNIEAATRVQSPVTGTT